MMIHVFLIYFSLIKYTVLGFLKTRLCFFGCYHVSRGFSLAWLLTFTKSFASIACQSRSWFVSYQNTKRRRKAEKFEVLPYWGGHLSFKIVTVCVIIMNFKKLEHLKSGIKGEELFL